MWLPSPPPSSDPFVATELHPGWYWRSGVGDCSRSSRYLQLQQLLSRLKYSLGFAAG